MDAEQLVHLRRKYRDRMLQVAFIVSQWSPQKEGGHGCVLAIDGKFIVATGFTGPDRAWRPEEGCGGTCCVPRIVHAEENAIINLCSAGVNGAGNLTAYVTKKPCADCYAVLRKIGVIAIFWLQDLNGNECGWHISEGEKTDGFGKAQDNS